MRVEEIVFLEITAVGGFDDAANLYIWQWEGLGQIFHTLGFDDGLVECFSVEV